MTVILTVNNHAAVNVAKALDRNVIGFKLGMSRSAFDIAVTIEPSELPEDTDINPMTEEFGWLTPPARLLSPAEQAIIAQQTMLGKLLVDCRKRIA